MGRKSREHSARQALAARMSAQFDSALSEAALTIRSFGQGWDDIGPGRSGDAVAGPEVEVVPLEFQLADLERAVDLLLEERDRFLYGHGGTVLHAARDNAPATSAATEKEP
jgi:hypothetical protein